jgi:acetyltransferase-like isoleucine patch superfamily enzyme
LRGDRSTLDWKNLVCVLGDGCQIGCNAVLNPGTLLGADAFVIRWSMCMA